MSTSTFTLLVEGVLGTPSDSSWMSKVICTSLPSGMTETVYTGSGHSSVARTG